MSWEDFNPDKYNKNKENGTYENITLDNALGNEFVKAMQIAMTSKVANTISSLSPDSDQTLIDVMFDALDCDSDEAMQYVVDVTMDFLHSVGASSTAIDDLLSDDREIALDEMQELTSSINSITNDSISIPQLVTLSVNFDNISNEFDFEDNVTLDSVTQDWAFAQNRSTKPLKIDGGHKMKNVVCERTVDGVFKKGFCRYPESLLNGKYKKSKKMGLKDKRKHLAGLAKSGAVSKMKKATWAKKRKDKSTKKQKI